MIGLYWDCASFNQFSICWRFEGVDPFVRVEQFESEPFCFASGMGIGNQDLIGKLGDETVALFRKLGGDALLLVSKWGNEQQAAGLNGFLPFGRQPGGA